MTTYHDLLDSPDPATRASARRMIAKAAAKPANLEDIKTVAKMHEIIDAGGPAVGSAHRVLAKMGMGATDATARSAVEVAKAERVKSRIDELIKRGQRERWSAARLSAETSKLIEREFPAKRRRS